MRRRSQRFRPLTRFGHNQEQIILPASTHARNGQILEISQIPSSYEIILGNNCNILYTICIIEDIIEVIHLGPSTDNVDSNHIRTSCSN